MKIKVTVSIGLSGCRRTKVIEVTDDADDEEIDQISVESALDSIVRVSWERVP